MLQQFWRGILVKKEVPFQPSFLVNQKETDVAFRAFQPLIVSLEKNHYIVITLHKQFRQTVHFTLKMCFLNAVLVGNNLGHSEQPCLSQLDYNRSSSSVGMVRLLSGNWM